MLSFIIACIIIIAIIFSLIEVSKTYPSKKQSYSSSYSSYKQTSYSKPKTVDNSKLLPDYTVIDTETTGLDSKTDKIIQLAAIRYRNHAEYAKRIWLVNPGIPIPQEASNINHIYDSDVAGKPSFDDIADEFLAFIGNDVLLGYNTPFDKKFIEYELGEELKNKTVDCCYIARNNIKGLSNYKLTTLAHYFHISTENAHDALHDCVMTHKVFEEILNHNGRKGHQTDLYMLYPYNRPPRRFTNDEFKYPENPDKDNPFYKKHFVFTGTLPIRRKVAIQRVINLGATFGQTVIKKTDYLVIGTSPEPSMKRQKADELRNEGIDIKIISGYEFIKLLVEAESFSQKPRLSDNIEPKEVAE